MRAALHGTLDDWVPWDDSGLRWHRPDHPEDGVITLREGLAFKDYYAKRSEPEEPHVDPLVELEKRVAALEAVVKHNTDKDNGIEGVQPSTRVSPVEVPSKSR